LRFEVCDDFAGASRVSCAFAVYAIEDVGHGLGRV
jgi:hypothetical protein